MRLIIPLISLLITNSAVLYALPFKHKKTTTVKNLQQATINFSGKWVGRCDDSAETIEMTIAQDRTSLRFSFPYEDEDVVFKISGVNANTDSYGSQTKNTVGIANWNNDSSAIYLNDLRWLERPGSFNLNYNQTVMKLHDSILSFDSLYFFVADTAKMQELSHYQCRFEKKD